MVSPRSIVVHQGFRSKEVRRAIKLTSHSSLLVALQGDVSRKLNQAFIFVDLFNFNVYNFTSFFTHCSFDGFVHAYFFIVIVFFSVFLSVFNLICIVLPLLVKLDYH